MSEWGRCTAQDWWGSVGSWKGSWVEGPLGSTGTAMEVEENRSGPGRSPMGSGLEMEGKPRYTHCLGPASIGSPQVPEKVT